MEVQLGAAKVAKYAAGESGDSIELIERPLGGVSAVLVDGQRSGRSAKIISNIVARKAVSLLGEGVRDGAVARAAHDYLRTHRAGQVSAELQMISVALITRTLVISRNSRCISLVVRAGQLCALDAPSQPIGIYANTKPVIVELPVEQGTYVLAYTDGICIAGERKGASLDLPALLEAAAHDAVPAQALADEVLARALEAEDGRPRDDMSVLVLAVLPSTGVGGVRRFFASFPV